MVTFYIPAPRCATWRQLSQKNIFWLSKVKVGFRHHPRNFLKSTASLLNDEVCIVSWGTRGDCTPMIVVARELKRRGHTVRLLINDRGDNFASKSEFPDKRDLAGTYDDEISDDLKLTLMSSDNVADATAAFNDIMRPLFPKQLEQILEAGDGMDMLVYTAGVRHLALAVADKLEIPCINVALQPEVPTSHEPCCYVSPKPFMFKWFTNLTWRLAGSSEFKGLEQNINPLRERLGLDPIKPEKGGALYLTARHPLPLICAFSSELSPLPPDAPSRCPGALQGDYPFSAAEEKQVEAEFVPSDELLKFLNPTESQPQPKKPVYIGWGSMCAGDRTFASELAFRALRASGERGVIFRGNAGLSVTQLDASQPDYEEVRAYAEQNSIEVDFVPHSWLFPQCAAAVHHGGSGSTHTALRAGIPSIITPFGVDQPYWQYRCFATGIAPEAPKFWDITWKELGRIIAATVKDNAMCARAAEAGERARSLPEDGAQMVASRIEDSAADTEMWSRYFDNGGFTGPDCWQDRRGDRTGSSSCVGWWL